MNFYCTVTIVHKSFIISLLKVLSDDLEVVQKCVLYKEES
jgi:hypothetical protein